MKACQMIKNNLIPKNKEGENKAMLRSVFSALLVIAIQTYACVASYPVFIIVGPPGCGKGTFSQYMAHHQNYAHISAGDLLRIEARNPDSPYRQEIEVAQSTGQAVSASLMQNILSQYIKQSLPLRTGLIIDGFGGQHESDMPYLATLLDDLDVKERAMMIDFSCDNDICTERMGNRLLCYDCNAIFTTIDCLENCTHCSGRLIQKPGDTIEVIERRLIRYRNSMEPNYQKGYAFFPVIQINAKQSLNEVIDQFNLLTRGREWNSSEDR